MSILMRVRLVLCGVAMKIPPAQIRHKLCVNAGAVEHEIERHERKAPEQEFAFHDPHAFQVGFDGLFLVEEEPSRDGKEDDDADLAATSHEESGKISIASGSLLIGKPFWVIKWYIRIMNIAMMRSSSMLEFLCPPPFAIRECAGAPCLAFMRLSFSASWFFCSQFSSSLWSLFPPNPTHPNRLGYSIKR